MRVVPVKVPARRRSVFDEDFDVMSGYRLSYSSEFPTVRFEATVWDFASVPDIPKGLARAYLVIDWNRVDSRWRLVVKELLTAMLCPLHPAVVALPQRRQWPLPFISMKILALYDIHGNPDALGAVLGDSRAEGADVIVVGGDVVPGARAHEALECLDGVSVPLQWVRGNGEREVAAAALGFDTGEPAVSTGAVTAAELGVPRARALGGLPLTVTIDGVLFCHASPRRDDEMLTRLSPPERWAKALAGVDAALIVGGHTHQQDDRVVGGIRFINSGSVGLPYEGDGDARWLWIENGVPELRCTAYDHAAAGRRMLQTGYPDVESIEGSLIEPVEAITVTRLFEQRADD